MGVERARVPTEDLEQDAPGDEGEHDREHGTDEHVDEPKPEAHPAPPGLGRVTTLRSDRFLRHHAASAGSSPTISCPTSSAAPGPFGTTPTRRPRDSTAIRSQISISSSRSVEIRNAAA